MTTRARFLAPAAAVAVALALLAGCGQATSQSTTGPTNESATNTGPASAAPPSANVEELLASSPRLDAVAKEALDTPSFDAADPQFPILGYEQFDVAVVGTLTEVDAGPTQPVFAGDPDPLGTIVLEVTPTLVLHGDAEVGQPIFVRLAIDDLEGLTSALPAGTLTFVAASNVDPTFDEQLIDPFAGVPQGEQRYVAGAPYAAFADGPLNTWFPLLERTFRRPLTGLLTPR
ncbi:hypothetical protein [Nocardioides sp.]|uniref:hypothetical protein n=1 Tax=Nocardioides sp. TaxID=35761 RepID=UPI00261C8C3F|nr:hypothetical protein [Nocardioides sp.]